MRGALLAGHCSTANQVPGQRCAEWNEWNILKACHLVAAVQSHGSRSVQFSTGIVIWCCCALAALGHFWDISGKFVDLVFA